MWVFVHPAVPVAVHEVLVDAAGGLVKAGIELVDVGGTLDGEVADVEDSVAFGRDFEAFEATFHRCQDFLRLLVDFHGDNAAATGKEDCVVVEPYGIELAFGGVGEADGLSFVLKVYEIEFSVALVLGYAVIGVGVDQLGAVGTDCELAHLAKFPHDFGCETPIFNFHIGFADDVVELLFLLAACCQHQGCCE